MNLIGVNRRRFGARIDPSRKDREERIMATIRARGRLHLSASGDYSVHDEAVQRLVAQGMIKIVRPDGRPKWTDKFKRRGPGERHTLAVFS